MKFHSKEEIGTLNMLWLSLKTLIYICQQQQNITFHILFNRAATCLATFYLFSIKNIRLFKKKIIEKIQIVF